MKARQLNHVRIGVENVDQGLKRGGNGAGRGKGKEGGKRMKGKERKKRGTCQRKSYFNSSQGTLKVIS